MEREKIRLKNGQEFELVPMGIEAREKRRTFKIVSQLSQEEVMAIFRDSDNLASIDYVLSDGTVQHTYLDCVAIKGLGVTLDCQVDENTVADVYTVEISTDAVEKILQSLQKNITYTELALVEIYEVMLGGAI